MNLAFRKERKMSSTKILASIFLVLAVLFTQVGNVAAAPQIQETTPPQVTEITTETDESGVTTVLVTLLLEDQTTQQVRISLEYATEIGLINSETGEPVLPEEVPDGATIDPGQVIEVIPVEEPTEVAVHPIAWLLSQFFGEDPTVVNDYHEDGFGFGVIAQALWISRNITGTESETGNASLAEEILQAKADKDFQAFFDSHPEFFGEEESAPSNWGQFKKSLLEKKNNLGVIVSGQEESDTTTDSALTDQDHGNGRNKEKKEKNNNNNNRP
jgi:hypothetical protein